MPLLGKTSKELSLLSSGRRSKELFPLKVNSCQTLSSPIVLLYRPSKETEIHISILFTGSLLQNSSLFHINLQQYSPVSTDRAVIRTILNSSNRHNTATTRKAKLVAYKMSLYRPYSNSTQEVVPKLMCQPCFKTNLITIQIQNVFNSNTSETIFSS